MMHNMRGRRPSTAGAWCTLAVMLGIQLIRPALGVDGNDDPARETGTASTFSTGFEESAATDDDASLNGGLAGGGGKASVVFADDDGDKPDTKPWDYGSDRRDDPTNYTLMKNDPELDAGRDRRTHSCTPFETTPRQPPTNANGGTIPHALHSDRNRFAPAADAGLAESHFSDYLDHSDMCEESTVNQRGRAGGF